VKFSFAFKLLIAFILPLSSTGVVVKLLDEMGEFGTRNGTMILSVLIVQDLILVPMMLILRGLSTQVSIFQVLGNVVFASAILIALIIYLGKPYTRLFNPLKLIFSGKQEILTLASMALCCVLASVSSFLGLSSAYGAFIGGVIIGSFANNREILQFAQPISSMLVMLFFVSVGLQVDLHYFSTNWKILALAFVMFVIAKVLINYVIMRIMQFSKKRSIFISSMLSQASEFAFILISILADKILSKDQANLLTALVIISLTIGTFLPIFAQIWYKLYKKKRL
jgi:CPA2 family monovalent cation:H+ antiporter-2